MPLMGFDYIESVNFKRVTSRITPSNHGVLLNESSSESSLSPSEDQLRVVKTRHAIDNKVTVVTVLWQTIKEHMIKSVKEYLLMVSGETSAVSLRKIFASLQVL